MTKKIVVLNNGKIELWTNLGQSASAINMGGYTFIGYTNEFMFAENEEDLVEKMQKDIDNGECYKYGSGTLHDWAVAKYNL